MDKNGFLIVHKHFVDAKTLTNLKELAKRISSVHITVQEKGIAEDLIDRNILRLKQCKKYKEIALENFYEVHLAGTVKSSFCPNYQISYLEGTNAYLGELRQLGRGGWRSRCKGGMPDVGAGEGYILRGKNGEEWITRLTGQMYCILLAQRAKYSPS